MFSSRVSNRLSAIFLIASICFLGCARSFNPNIERGSTYNFREGFPEFRFTAIGVIDESGQPIISVTANIVYGSLIYKQKGSNYAADIVLDLQILSDGKIAESKRFTPTVENSDPNITYSQETFSFTQNLPASPGDYEIICTLTDQTSAKKIVNSAHAFIPDPNSEEPNLTNIMMLGKDLDNGSADWFPITTYDIAGRIDSLKFVFQVTNSTSDEPLIINSQLIRFRSDTTIARPMHYSDYSPSSLQYKGIEFDKKEILQSTQRKLLDTGNVLIEFAFAQQERGNYRFEVETNRAGEKTNTLFKARDFGVKSTNYPAIRTARELAAPLIYLMGDKEYKQLMAINDTDSLKQTVDRFWLRHIGSKGQARSVIEKYYQRVEEANKQFSNFKEGWKTDAGMIYILFGPPWYVERNLKEVWWSYSYDRSDPERNFLFVRNKLQSEFFPFEHYLFQRSTSYFNVQYQLVQLWLSENILSRSL